MLTMPLFFYNTTLVWVDDDEFFVNAIASTFKKDYCTKIFLLPNSFLNFFSKYTPISENISFLRGSNGDDEYEVNHRLPVEIDFQAIIDLYNNKQRHHDISTIIVDFKMPQLTGLDLIQKTPISIVKRILLTGEAEDQLAISAFNHNIIDRFVHKGNSNFISDLKLYLKQLTMQYFRDMTKPLLAHLEVDYRLPQSDLVFVNFFNQWMDVNNIVEYFVFDKNGSMLVTNDRGQSFYFIVHTERSLDAFSELHASNKSVSLFVNAVMQRYKIPFFGLFREGWEFESAQWSDYFYTPEVFQGQERYYWKAIAQ